MQNLSWKTLIAVLWLLQTVNYVALILITQVESGVFGTLEPGSGAELIAIFFFIPALLAWLAFAARPSIGKWLHIVFGVLFTVVKLIATVTGLTDGMSFSYLFNEVWGMLAAALIVWYAWKAPQS